MKRNKMYLPANGFAPPKREGSGRMALSALFKSETRI